MSELVNNLAKDNVTITKLLIIQLIAFVSTSLVLYFKDSFWPVMSICGGLVAWLPNVAFVLFTQHNLTRTSNSNAISWSFMLAWVFKLIVTIIFLIVAIAVFKAEFIPLGLGFLSVIIMQFLAPIIVSIFRN